MVWRTAKHGGDDEQNSNRHNNQRSSGRKQSTLSSLSATFFENPPKTMGKRSAVVQAFAE